MIKKFFCFAIILLFIGCNGNKASKNEVGKTNGREKPGSFFFVGMKDYEPSIFKFNLDSLNQSLVWHEKDHEVTELSYSPDRKNIFFITASGEGKKGVFPFINDVNVYSLGIDSVKIEHLLNMGNGMQLFNFWESNSLFKVVLNSFDTVKSNTIVHHAVEFNINGRKTSDRIKRYNIIKQGYPEPEIFSNNNFSNGRFSIDTTNNDTTSIFLIDNEKKDTSLITTVNQKLNRTKWSNDGNYLFFSTLDISPRNESIYNKNPETSKLFIYSLKNKKVAKLFDGSGVKNFFINRDLLIFDTGFGKKSEIMIYDFVNKKLIKEIKIEGGCGLENIPQIPDFSA